jgi:hypothetical protein
MPGQVTHAAVHSGDGTVLAEYALDVSVVAEAAAACTKVSGAAPQRPAPPLAAAPGRRAAPLRDTPDRLGLTSTTPARPCRSTRWTRRTHA